METLGHLPDMDNDSPQNEHEAPYRWFGRTVYTRCFYGYTPNGTSVVLTTGGRIGRIIDAKGWFTSTDGRAIPLCNSNLDASTARALIWRNSNDELELFCGTFMGNLPYEISIDYIRSTGNIGRQGD